MRSSFLPYALLFAAAVGLATTPARAGSASLAQTLKGEAKSSYDSARLLYDDGDPRGALEKFRHAYELSKDPRLLWNMAVCEKELRHYGGAAALVGHYLKEGASVISAEQRQSALETQQALRAFYSSVSLSGAPASATVSIDGDVIGKTPLEETPRLDLGPHTLRVEQPGFQPFETKLDVVGGADIDVPVTLERAPVASAATAQLSVSSAGERDTVAVDGKVVGSQHWEGALAPGEHLVRVTAPQKKPYEAHLQLLARSSRSIRVNLEDEGTHSKAWLWITGGGALLAGAVVGGYFLFKPQDTPGSHPDGKLATVYLPLGGGR